METTSPKLFDMLNESPRALTLRTIHRDFFLELAEAAEVELHGPDQVAWLDAVQAEHENLRTAIEWSLAQGDETALRFVAALWEFWEVRGFSTEGLEWAQRALTTGDQAPTSARARAHLGAGRLASLQGSPGADAIDLVSEGLAEARASNDGKTASSALRVLARLRFRNDGPAAAQPLLDESLQLATEINDDHEIAGALFDLSGGGVPDERRKSLERAIEIYRRVGDKRNLAWTLSALAYLTEDIESIRVRQTETLEIARELKDDRMLVMAFLGLALADHASGHYEQALSRHEESLETSRLRGPKQLLMQVLGGFGWFQLQSGEFAEARLHFQEHLEMARDLGNETLVAYALRDLARVADMQGDFPKAKALAEESVAVASKSGFKGAIAFAKGQLGYVTLHNGDTRGAREHIEESLAISSEIGRASRGSESFSKLGDLEKAEGNYAKARALFEEELKVTVGAVPRAQVLRKLGVVAMHEGDLDRASALHREALETYVRLGWKRLASRSIENVSALARVSGDFERAAKLFGAAEALGKVLRAPVWPPERAEHAALRTALDDPAFEADIAAGREMSYEEAIAYALEE